MGEEVDWFGNQYLNIKALKKMDEDDRKLFTSLYNRLIDCMLNPPDFDGRSRIDMMMSPESQCISHIKNTLTEYDVLVDLRELNINKIID